MPPNRTDRASRNGEIPDNFILNWRSSGSGVRRGTKSRPLVRRPPTACEACRSAKVKCSGKQDCERCVSRGITCKYTTRANNDRGQQPNLDASPRPDGTHPLPADGCVSWPPLPQLQTAFTTGEVPTDPDHNGARRPSQEHTACVFEPGITLGANTSADWASGIADPGLGNFDSHWGDLDPRNEQTFQPTPSELDLLQPLDSTASQTLARETYTYSLLHNNDSSHNANSASISPSCGLSTPNQSNSPTGCLHRASLMLLPPKIATAKQEKRLDQVFKVTGEAVKACQDMVDCTACQITCIDLLLMMTVLQETHPCFEYIAKSDLDTDVKVSFGGYEVSFNDASLRAMLVMDLVRRASAVLTAVSATGKSMMDNLAEPCRQARANIAYLDETISYFRTILQCVKGSTGSV